MKKTLRLKSVTLEKETIYSMNPVGGSGNLAENSGASYPDCSFTYGPSNCWSCIDCGPSGME